MVLVQYDAHLFSQTKLLQKLTILVDIGLFHILEQTPALADHLEQAPATGMVLRVCLEVSLQVIDAGGQQRDLDGAGTGISLRTTKFGDDFSLLFLGQHVQTP